MTKEEKILEYRKCKDEPIYFISKYIKVVHPILGLVPFKLYKFQEHILECLENHRFNILRKFRQAGCTTICAAYALWFSIFHQHKTVAILSKGDIEAVELVDRVKIMYSELPVWLKPKIVTDNNHTLKLANGSVIKSRSSGKQAGRSLSASLLIIDEAAFIENISTIWAAVYPIISTGGRVFALSTVNGVGNWYHTTWVDALDGTNSFHPIDIKWTDHPGYKRTPGYEDLYAKMEAQDPPILIDEWEKTTKSNVSRRVWLQEYEAEFLGTGETYIDGQILEELLDHVEEEYDRKYNNRMRIWREPDPRFTYVMGVDVSLGRGSDYSAFQIINAYDGTQVAEFYSNKTPLNEFAQIIFNEGNYYNTALVIIERNSIGSAIIEDLYQEMEYENLHQDSKGEVGIAITNKNRENLLSVMEEYIRLNKVKITSRRTVGELNTFIVNSQNKAVADRNCHDDLVLSLVLAIKGLHSLYKDVPLGVQPGISEMSPDGLIPSKSYVRTLKSYGGATEEDIKWLLGR